MRPLRSNTTRRASRKRASTASSSKYRSRAACRLPPPLLRLACTRIDVGSFEREIKIEEILRCPEFRRILQGETSTLPGSGWIDKSKGVGSKRNPHRHMEVGNVRLPAVSGGHLVPFFAYLNDQAWELWVPEVLIKEVMKILSALL